MAFHRLPSDWRERLKSVPDKSGLKEVARAVEIPSDSLIQFRKRNRDFDKACFDRMKVPRHAHPDNTKSDVVPKKPTVPLLPNKIESDELLTYLMRATPWVHVGNGGPTVEELTCGERQFVALLLQTSYDEIVKLRLERRQLYSRLNEAQVRIHTLKRTGPPQVQGTDGHAMQSSNPARA